jgi:hypothetical protein
MDITNFVSIGVVGALLSVLVQWFKAKFGTDGWGTKLMTIVLAIIVGFVYVVYAKTEIFTTILATLGAASTVYALLLK